MEKRFHTCEEWDWRWVCDWDISPVSINATMNTDTSGLVLDDLDVSGDPQGAYVVATADQTTNNNATRERYEEYMAAASRRVSMTA